MTATKKGDHWVADFRFNRRRYRLRSPVNTKRGAEAHEAQERASLLGRGRLSWDVEPVAEAPAAAPQKTLGEWLEEWAGTHYAMGHKPSSASSARAIVKHRLVPSLGAIPLEQLGRRDVERYKATRAEAGKKAKTINNELTVLRLALKTAVEWDLLSHAPRVAPLKAALPEFDYLDFLEADRLVEAAGEHRAIIVVALDTGLRRGELVALCWRDVDIKARALRVRHAIWRGHEHEPKSGKARTVPLTTRAGEALKAHRHLLDRVFSHPDGSVLSGDSMQRIIDRVTRRAGLRSVGWHVLRHTFASHLVQRGVPLKAVQELLGHSQIQTTMRYAHLAPATLRAAVDALEVGTSWAQCVRVKGK